MDDLLGLIECPSIEVLDLQQNEIEDVEVIDEILCKLPNLKVLYLMKNPLIKKIKMYRKTIITKIPTLKYLDDRPVFDDDRRYAEAWSRGGLEEERAERDKIRKEKDAKHEEYHRNFKAMMDKAREEKRQENERK